MKINRYCLGFMFNPSLTSVLLIRKNRPEWQAGKLNAIGGKLENGESDLRGIHREILEETGISLKTKDPISCFAELSGRTENEKEFFRIYCFAIQTDIMKAKSTTDEIVERVYIKFLNDIQESLIENTFWLTHLAIDHLKDGRPDFVSARY